jgi:hypothetical protein
MGIAVFQMRRRRVKNRELKMENINNDIEKAMSPNPMLFASAPELVKFPTIEVNPLLVVPKFEFEENILLKPDNLDDDDVALAVFETIVKDEGDGSFDSLIENVKGTPLYGTMSKMTDTKKKEFLIKLKHRSEVETVISKLRRVNRASIDNSSTTSKQIRVQMRWNALFEKIVA